MEAAKAGGGQWTAGLDGPLAGDVALAGDGALVQNVVERSSGGRLAALRRVWLHELQQMAKQRQSAKHRPSEQVADELFAADALY